MDNSLIDDFLMEYHNSKNIKHKYREIIGPISTEKLIINAIHYII